MPDTRERVTLMPFGLRVLAPLASGKAEVFAGSGGAPYWTSEPFLGSAYSKETLLWHLNGGVRVRLDSNGRFRLSPTVRYYRDAQAHPAMGIGHR